ncbi:MAG: YggS family pyridoxal phosphate-dependent enzyme [Phycisphaerales bacterium]
MEKTSDRSSGVERGSVAERYAAVKQRIDAALDRSGRAGEPVVLVAVTKYARIDQIRQLLLAGHADLGENRLQVFEQHSAEVDEFLERFREVPSAAPAGVSTDVRWHMIGHLQRNKVRRIVDKVRLIHSVDSLRLAEEIQTAAAARTPDSAVEVLVQVNVAGEDQKYGVAPAAAVHLIEQIDTMYNVNVRGLMCMAPISDDPEASRPVFIRCRELFDEIRLSGVVNETFDLLSMGMSGDYEVAIECGSNIVRVGSALFGSSEEEAADEGAQD